jgi:hypothetical protein
MIIITHGLLAFPLLLVIWALDTFLLVVFLRLLLARLKGPGLARYCSLLAPLTDPPCAAVQCWLAARLRTPTPTWLPWAILVGGLLTIQQILVRIVISLG